MDTQKQYDPHCDMDDVTWGTLLMLLCLAVLCWIEDVWEAHKYMVLRLVVIVGAVVAECLLVHSQFILLVTAGLTIALALFTLVIIAMTLENQNCNVRTADELWKRTKAVGFFTGVGITWVVIIAAAAAWVQFGTSYSIYLPGVIVSAIAGPFLIWSIGNLTIRSYAIIERDT